MYYRLPPRKRMHSYLMPFLIIVVIFVAVIFGWRALSGFLVDQNRNTVNEKVFLNIENGSAKAMTVGKSEWQNAPDKIYLYRGEGLKTGTDGRASLTFFDQSIMRLNTNTEVSFSSLKKKNDTNNIQVDLKKGDLWTKVERITNPDSTFSVTTDQITIDSRGGVFSVTAPSTVYLMQGSAQIGIKYDDEVIKTYTLGVGQQFNLDPAQIDSIRKGGEVEVIFALSDPFKKTNWYHWNAKKDGMIDAFEESGTEESAADATTDTATGATTGSATGSTTDLANMDRVVYVTSPGKDTETSKSSIAVEGNLDTAKVKAVYVNGTKATLSGTNKWRVDSVRLLIEGENKIKVEAEDLAGVKTTLDSLVVIYDKTPPTLPVITEPAVKDGVPYVIEDVKQLITGTVSADTQAVIVDDYRLGKYVPGSKTFQYYAKTEFGNLKVGENEFKVYAEDKAGNQSKPAVVVLKLDQSVVDKAGVTLPAEGTTGTTSTTAPSALPQASSTGGVKITAPNNGVSFQTSETEFEIAGTVPDGTDKVTVNDYPLSLFTTGNTTFKYRAYKSLGNLTIGAKNTYTVKALDESGKVLGSAAITIDVESGASADPVITMPSSSATYATTLDTIVLGGTIGKWVSRVYVNDKEIADYIPGSEKWKTSVKLETGKNTFTIVGERNGEQTGKATIIITYQP